MSRLFTHKSAKITTAILTVIILVIAMLPLHVLAETTPQTSESQIEGTETPLYFGDGAAFEGTTDPLKTIRYESENLFINMSKSIKGTDIENEFLLTLEVETNSNVSSSSRSDAAVVIVLDISGSMLKNQTGGGTIQPVDNRRLTKAVNAINKFIEDFAQVKDASNNLIAGERWISIVVFGNNNNVHLLRDWVNIGNEDGNPLTSSELNFAKIVYEATDGTSGSLTGDSGIDPMLDTSQTTCISKGLSMAISQLESFKPDNENIDVSMNTILFTDGEPNQNDGANNGNSTNNSPPNYIGTQTNVNYQWAEHRAESLKPMSNLFAVAYGGTDHSNWLRDSIATKPAFCYDGDDSLDLSGVFTVINNEINTLADAWMVTDPMGNNIQFIKTVTDNSDSVTFEDAAGILHWDLKNDPTFTYNAETRVKAYTLTYLVKLDTTAIASAAWDENVSKYFPTNKTTTLSYAFLGEDENGNEVFFKNGFENFLIPSVQGYRNSFAFTKTGTGSSALEGAEFMLYLGTGDSKTEFVNEVTLGNAVTSGGNGLTAFGYLPSGHTYTLIETRAPDGYARDLTEYVITVSYGALSFTPENESLTEADGEYVFKNDPDMAKIAIDKKVAFAAGYNSPEDIPDDAWKDALSITTNGSVQVYYKITITLLRGDYTIEGTAVDATLKSEWKYIVSPDAPQFTAYTESVRLQGNGTYTNEVIIRDAEITDGNSNDLNIPIVKDPDRSTAVVTIIGYGGGDPVPQYGALTLSKAFSGVTAPVPADWNATFTIAGPNNYRATYSYSQLPVTLRGLTPGTYTVNETDLSSIPGYVFVGSNGTGSYSVTANNTVSAVITNTYSTDSSVITETPPPTGIPDEDTPLTELPDEDPPLTNLPDGELPLTDLDDDEAPLGELPQTGVSAAFAPLAAAGLGLLGAGVYLKGKRKEPDEANDETNA